jgi:hypothetical protein
MKNFKNMSLVAVAAGFVLVSGSVRPLRAASLATPISFAQDHDDRRDRDDRRWQEPPSEFDEYARRGFHDGIEGAHRDFDNHRSPDPRHRDEFRHPHVEREFRDAYRRGFERGYRTGWDHIEHGERR